MYIEQLFIGQEIRRNKEATWTILKSHRLLNRDILQTRS